MTYAEKIDPTTACSIRGARPTSWSGACVRSTPHIGAYVELR